MLTKVAIIVHLNVLRVSFDSQMEAHCRVSFPRMNIKEGFPHIQFVFIQKINQFALHAHPLIFQVPFVGLVGTFSHNGLIFMLVDIGDDFNILLNHFIGNINGFPLIQKERILFELLFYQWQICKPLLIALFHHQSPFVVLHVFNGTYTKFDWFHHMSLPLDGFTSPFFNYSDHKQYIKSKMFGSKVRMFSKLLLNKGTTLLRSQRQNASKIALLAASLLLLPTYIHMKTSSSAQSAGHSQHNHDEHIQSSPPQERESESHVGSQIINFIESYEDAKKLNLQGNILVWFQTTGLEYIDAEVIDMLTKFRDEKQKSIGCPFKIIIDRTPRTKPIGSDQDYYKKEVQLVIVKPDNLKVIPLSKHLSFGGVKDLRYSNLFQRLTTELNQFNQINSTNVKDFMSSLGNKSYEASIVMSAPKDSIKMRKAKKKFRSFLDSKQAFAANTSRSIITDENVIRSLELPDFHPESDNIYVIIPESENIAHPGKIVKINDQTYHIYPSWAVNKSVVFSPYLQKSNPDSVTLKVTVDLNQNISSQLAQIYQILTKSDQYPTLASVPKFLTFHSFTQKSSKPIQISVQKNNFDQIVSVYSPGCRYSQEEKRDILYSGNKWKYNSDEITAESLEQWISDILNHRIDTYFESEPIAQTKVKQYNSIQLTGQEYAEALEKNKQKPKVIFHFSEHCFSCNKFKHLYEEIAEEQSQNFDFYRIDNDANRSQGLRNYNSTPIFVFYKNGSPYFFKNTIFTKPIFEDFLDITNKVHTIDQTLIDKAVQQRLENDFKMADLL